MVTGKIEPCKTLSCLNRQVEKSSYTDNITDINDFAHENTAIEDVISLLVSCGC